MSGIAGKVLRLLDFKRRTVLGCSEEGCQVSPDGLGNAEIPGTMLASAWVPGPRLRYSALAAMRYLMRVFFEHDVEYGTSREGQADRRVLGRGSEQNLSGYCCYKSTALCFLLVICRDRRRNNNNVRSLAVDVGVLAS